MKEIEQKFKKIIDRQMQYGIHFDLEAANEIAKELNITNIELKSKIRSLGLKSDLNARDQLIKELLDQGWQPKILKKTGDPCLNKKVFEIEQEEIFKILAQYYKTEKKLQLLKTGDMSFIKCCDPKKSRIYPQIDPDGANTHRMITTNPNITQLPKSMRKLLNAPKGKELLSIDAKSLELVMLGFYLIVFDQGKYASLANSTDVHEYYKEKIHLNSRDEAKTIIYGILYGRNHTAVGVDIYQENILDFNQKEIEEEKKLLKIKNFNNREFVSLDKDTYIEYSPYIAKASLYGKYVINKFYEETQGLKQLIEALKTKKEIYTIDGRKLNIRADYTILNTLLQSAGAITIKHITNNLENELCNKFKYGEDYAFTANFHDEIIMEINPSIKDQIKAIAQSTFIRSSKELMASTLPQHLHQYIHPVYGVIK